ncbi:MAG TPA: plasmid stabilization protein [Actinomycetota bacterium]|nr:plasmid stabilization protein [Actinomycetota bacterium]
MATRKQTSAARRNIRKAAAAAKRKRTISKLPKATRQDLSRNAAAARRRGGKPGRRLEDRTRAQLYEQAKRRNIAGRSSMGKSQLIDALRSG